MLRGVFNVPETFTIFPLGRGSNRLISDFINTGVSRLLLDGSGLKGAKWEYCEMHSTEASGMATFYVDIFGGKQISRMLHMCVPRCRGNRLAGTFCHNVHCSKLEFPVFSLLRRQLG